MLRRSGTVPVAGFRILIPNVCSAFTVDFEIPLRSNVSAAVNPMHAATNTQEIFEGQTIRVRQVPAAASVSVASG